MKDSKWYRFWATEIGIEYKACLYFFAILVYLAGYLMLNGIFCVRLIYLAEIIGTTYIMGYIQTYLLGNVDEAPRFNAKILLIMFLCSVVYTVISYLFGWFDRNMTATVIFLFYTMLEYICALIINRIKRDVDTRELNEMLKDFQNRV